MENQSKRRKHVSMICIKLTMTENNRPPCIKNMHSQSNFGYTEIPSVFSSHCYPVIDISFVSSVRFYTVYAFLLWLTMSSLYQCNIFLSFMVNGCIRTKFSNRRQTRFMPSDHEVIKRFSYMKFFLLINVKMPAIFGM